MSVFINHNTRVLVQGITGTEGQKLARKMIEFGTHVVAGVSPGNGGDWFMDGKIPIFDSTHNAVELTGANVALVTVPARFAKDALLECAAANIRLVISITEGIPLKDMMLVKRFYQMNSVRLLGPSSPGILSPGLSMIGSFPFREIKTGDVGIVSRSGSLTYEAIDTLQAAGVGISTCVGIGSAPIHGLGFIEVLDAMQMDMATQEIVLIGKVGSDEEIEALAYAQNNILKPITVYLYGYSHSDKNNTGLISDNFAIAKTMKELADILTTKRNYSKISST